MEFEDPRMVQLWLGLGLGIIFGAIAGPQRFCFRAAVAEWVERKDGMRNGAWWTALAAAATGMTLLFTLSPDIAMEDSLFFQTRLTPLSTIIGGLMFGAGMGLARGCATRHIMLAGIGNGRSWVVLLVVAVTAYMTLRGLFAPLRIWIENAWLIESEETAFVLTDMLSDDRVYSQGLFAAGFAVLVALVAFLRPSTRIGPLKRLGSILIGLSVPAALYITGDLTFDEFEPVAPQAMNLVSPIANGLQLLMTWTGAKASFPILVLAGIFLGALVMGLIRREWAFTGFTDRFQFLRSFIGAALMGVGGVMALGCTMGNGLSGLSMLSINSLLALICIAIGGFVTIKLRLKIEGSH